MMLETFGLFLGALFDAVIGPNLFVAGEPFLLAAGYQLHQGECYGVIAVLLGGFLGDQTSFFIGRHFGTVVRKKIITWQPRTRRTVARCRLLMKKNGNKVLTFARLLGPVAWVVPFLAGTERIGWRRFTLFSFAGLILGVGQFVVWGWILAAGAERFLFLMRIEAFFVANNRIMLLIALSACLLFGYKKYRLLSGK